MFPLLWILLQILETSYSIELGKSSVLASMGKFWESLFFLPSCWRMLSLSCSLYGCPSCPTWPKELWLSSSWAWTWVCDRKNGSPWALALGSHRVLGKLWEFPYKLRPGQICRREHEPDSPFHSHFPPCFPLNSCPCWCEGSCALPVCWSSWCCSDQLLSPMGHKHYSPIKEREN